MNADSPLWAALGWPTGARPLPLASSREWACARRSLALNIGPGFPRVRSPAALCAVLGLPGCSATWRDVCHERTVAHLRAALQARDCRSSASVTSWNVRWLRDPHAVGAAR